MLTLPDHVRDAFKEPMGSVTTDTEVLVAAAAETREAYGAPDAPIVAVGDVVTYHLRMADQVPDVAIVDGRTEREAVEAEIANALSAVDGRRIHVENPPGALSEAILAAIVAAIGDADPVVIEVDGEEDLAALPAILVTPIGGTVVYGQPGEGMVRVAVTPESRSDARELFARLDGDVEAAYERLRIDTDD